jgi:hypothetical protein
MESGQIDLTHGTIANETPAFDHVCANLTLDVIEPLLPLLLAKTKQATRYVGYSGRAKGVDHDQLFRLGSLNRPQNRRRVDLSFVRAVNLFGRYRNG